MMKILNVSSIPRLNLLQKACEVLVVDNLINMQHTYNVADRKQLIDENQQANEMIELLRDLLKSN